MTMRTTQLGANKALVRKAVGYNHGSSDSADEIFAPDFVAYMPSQPPMDRAGMERFIGDFADAFPGYTYEIHEQVAHGDMVFNHTTWRGVHSGTFAGVTATGRSIELGGINVFKVRDGSVVRIGPSRRAAADRRRSVVIAVAIVVRTPTLFMANQFSPVRFPKEHSGRGDSMSGTRTLCGTR
ncbi:MAG: ester cyclase [Nitrolancea sp.]